MENFLQNTKFLNQVFGDDPDISRVNLTAATLEYGRFVKLDFVILKRAIKMPPKWQDFNGISASIKFADVDLFSLEYKQNQLHETSHLKFRSLSTQFHVVVRGQVECSFVTSGGWIDDFQPALVTSVSQPN